MRIVADPTLSTPYRIDFRGKSYHFDPDCDVPDELGKHLLASLPNKFHRPEEAKPVEPVVPRPQKLGRRKNVAQ